MRNFFFIFPCCLLRCRRRRCQLCSMPDIIIVINVQYRQRQRLREHPTEPFTNFSVMQNYPDITNRTVALMSMPKGRYQNLRKLIPLLVNQSEDCLTLNIYVPASGKYNI